MHFFVLFCRNRRLRAFLKSLPGIFFPCRESFFLSLSKPKSEFHPCTRQTQTPSTMSIELSFSMGATHYTPIHRHQINKTDTVHTIRSASLPGSLELSGGIITDTSCTRQTMSRTLDITSAASLPGSVELSGGIVLSWRCRHTQYAAAAAPPAGPSFILLGPDNQNDIR